MLCVVGPVCITQRNTHSFSGDLKLVEKPQPIMLGPNDFSNIKVPFFILLSGIVFGHFSAMYFSDMQRLLKRCVAKLHYCLSL